MSRLMPTWFRATAYGVLAAFVIVTSGCLPSPHKPMGGRSESENKPDKPTPNIVNRPVEKVDVPVFGPDSKTQTSTSSDSETNQSLAPLQPLLAPLGRDTKSPNSRLSLAPEAPSKKPFTDTPLPPLNQLPSLETVAKDTSPPVIPPQPVANALDSSATDATTTANAPVDPPPLMLIPETPPTNSTADGGSDKPVLSPTVPSLAATTETPQPSLPKLDNLDASDSLEPIPVPLVDVRDGGSYARRFGNGPPPLIPREKLFSRSERSWARISPDGKLLAFLAERNGVVNIFVAPADDLNSARPVTNDSNEGIQNFLWAFTGRHILFLQSSDAGKTDHVHCVNLDTSEVKDLTPIANASAYVAAASHKMPAEVMVAISARDPHHFYDIYRVNIVTGKRKLIEENNRYEGFEIDDDYRIRIAHRRSPEGGRIFATRDNANVPWKDFLVANPEDALGTGVVGFDQTGDQVYFVDSRHTDRSVLKVVDLVGEREKRLAEHNLADVTGTLVHPTEKHVQAVTFTYDRQKWEVLDDRINADLEYLHTIEDGELEITSRTLDDTLWTVVFRRDDGPAKYYLYRREPRSTKLLFNSRPDLVDMPLAKMHPLTIPTRDGMTMVSYLTLPLGSDAATAGQPSQPLPMVLLVHAGPWARDVWGYNELHQMLANRGYAVLSANYRGSTGFGKSFTNAGNREWAGKMHDDLIDAVQWAVNRRIALQDRVAIMGGSYGGYASLVGLTFSPNVFACGIDVVGPSSLVTLLENPLAQWASVAPLLSSRVGDLQSPQGRDFLMSRSPLRFVDRISRPLLIAQGGQDRVAKKEDADQVVQSMQSANIPVTYMLYPDEGHGFKRPANRLAFYAVAEAFLADHLGGRAEPIGAALSSSSVQIPTGRDKIRALTGTDLGLGSETATRPSLSPLN